MIYQMIAVQAFKLMNMIYLLQEKLEHWETLPSWVKKLSQQLPFSEEEFNQNNV